MMAISFDSICLNGGIRMKRFPGFRVCLSFAATAILLLIFFLPLSFSSDGKFPFQEKSKTLLSLLEEESPLSDLIYELDDCYQRFQSIIETEERRLQDEKDKALLEFWDRLQKELADYNAQPDKKNKDSLASIGRMMQGIASEYNLEALMPGAPEERLERCRISLKMARFQLKTAQELEKAYAGILNRLGVPRLALPDSSQGWGQWAKEIEEFNCTGSKKRLPLQTEIVLPPHTRRPFVLKTFCLDGSRSGPGSGQAMAVTGHIQDLGRKNLAQMLLGVAANPDREIDIQQAIWDEGEEEKDDKDDPEIGGGMPAAGGKGSSGGSSSLSQAVSSGELSADASTRDNFTSVDIWLENLGDESRTVSVAGAVLDSGDSDVQRLVTAGVDKEKPPPGPKLKDPEKKIEEILKRAEEWLRKAQERVQNGDHSREAIEDLIKAMSAAEAVGMDLEDSDWDILRESVWEETDLTYKVYKANPTAENRKRWTISILRRENRRPLPT
jgi:hypothetical protein